jgi:ADP-ribosylglycohydrolase
MGAAAARLDQARDRATAALAGVALGDAMGMPSQTLSRDAIRAAYGRIEDFTDPMPDHPVSHGLRAAMVTDDTEQTLLLAEVLLARPEAFDAAAWAQALLRWEDGIRVRGLRDLLGPSSKAALAALLAGTPADQAGRGGTTNGAAMRIAPVAIATPSHDLPALVARVAETCRVTHNTREAIAAAAAVAAVISHGIDGAGFDAALPAALEAARIGATQGAPVGEPDMAARIALALRQPDEGTLAEAVGTSVASRASVPCAFGVVRLARGDPWDAARIAANIGDDTDTIGAIACGMAGACAGLAAFPAAPLERLLRINRLDLAPLAARLLALRDRTAGPA